MKWLVTLVLFLFLFSHIALAKLRVCTSIYILATIVKQIGQDKVTTNYVIPPSSNPHLFSPKPRELINFTKADLFIGVGYNFEFWFKKVAFLRKNKTNLFLSSYYRHPISEVKINNTVFANPHIWLDIDFMRTKGIPVILRYMCQKDKKDCSYFKKNATKLEDLLKKTKKTYTIRANKLKTCIVDIKPAFEYLLKSIGLSSCAVLIKNGQEATSLGDIKKVFKHCRCKRGIIIYINRVSLAKNLATILHYTPLKLNPLGNPQSESENNYIKLLNYDLSRLKQAINNYD